ncbi:ABC transporter ATP-binding protein [Cognatishimia sp. SS12]|uniref:ABC transporter ATP-binding protein n=1 Tax=Cognatishimia sp. SS12 TaxID=2979465 RepID=UPI00233114B1|nr:ABC transporter ATP-binding protein [Cognatishimia sp. SS12]MDC0739570.1 ABC transporter ATP-binding protein [Cognatishimia sp. SS12]
MLELTDITIEGETRRVVDGVSLDLKQGEIVALLGPNGAGKSELVLGIAGIMPLTGRVQIDGTEVARQSPQAIRAQGIAAVPEGHQTLSGLSVLDNLRAAGPNLSDQDLEGSVENAFLVFPELREKSGQAAGNLSGGQQQMVAIAQALVSRPKFLLLDEMSLGLAPVIIERLVAVVRKLRDGGMGILLIEQFTHLALDVADRAHVLTQGRLSYSGTPAELKADRSILERAYLG